MGAGGTRQFFTAQLAKRCGRPYVVAPLAHAAVAAPGQAETAPNEPPSVFDPRRPAAATSLKSQPRACGKAVYKLCTSWGHKM